MFIVTEKGFCKGTDEETELLFKNIQRQANRFLDSRGETLLYCDGIIGTKTLAAIRSLPGFGHTKNCQYIANQAKAYLASLTRIANRDGLTMPECPSRSIVQMIKDTPIAQATGFSFIMFGIAGVIGWFMFKDQIKEAMK